MKQRNINRWPLVLFSLLAGSTMACDEDTIIQPLDVNEAQVLVEFMEAQADYDIHGGFVISAADVRTNALTGADQYVIDMRSSTDFAAGHIDGAVNVAWNDLVDHISGLDPMASSFDVIVLACYSGQTAAYAAGILRARGYSNVKSMKWGMSSWHSDFSSPWMNNRSNQRVTQFQGGASPSKPAMGELPNLSTGLTSGASIRVARVNAVLEAGFTPAKITHAAVFQDPAAYFVVNFWPEALFENTGHIPGAVNYDPATKPFLSSTFLKTLPTDKAIVIYCYTGQGSAYLAGYLRVLGYDARTLLYGANGMIFDKMITDGVPSAFVPESQIMDYDYVM